MSGVFYLNRSDRAVRADALLIKCSDYQKMVKAEELIQQARASAEQIVADAQAAYHRQRERGYVDGMEAAKAEISETITASAISAAKYLSELEQRVVDLVMAALIKILGSMDSDELITRLASQAITSVRNQKEITVCVHPNCVSKVKQSLKQVKANMPMNKVLEVRPDSRLDMDACIVESDIGYVNGSLDVQLSAVRKAFEKEVQKRQES